jgi:hypothetical protein
VGYLAHMVCILDGLAVGESVADGGVPGDPLGDLEAGDDVFTLEEFFDPFVDEPEPGLHAQDGLAHDPEAEVAGLDEPGVHRTDRDLVDAGALDRDERERPGVGDHLGRVRSIRGASDASSPASAGGGPGGGAGGDPSGTMPKRSASSRSKRLAGNDREASVGSSGCARSSGTWSSTRVSGGPAVKR